MSKHCADQLYIQINNKAQHVPHVNYKVKALG